MTVENFLLMRVAKRIFEESKNPLVLGMCPKFLEGCDYVSENVPEGGRSYYKTTVCLNYYGVCELNQEELESARGNR